MKYVRMLLVIVASLSGLNSSIAQAQVARTAMWAGAYAGIHGIGATGKFTNAFALNQSLDGATGGLHVGYNAQVSNIVFGLVSDLNIGHLHGTRTAMGIETIDYRRTGFGSLRGKLGYAFGPLLVYATGGFAVAKFRYDDFVNFGPLFPPIRINHDDTKVGGIWGGGLAYRINERYSVSFEALSHSYSHVIYDDYKYRETNVRAGLSWHFN